jgi:hypothetical protein
MFMSWDTCFGIDCYEGTYWVGGDGAHVIGDAGALAYHRYRLGSGLGA